MISTGLGLRSEEIVAGTSFGIDLASFCWGCWSLKHWGRSRWHERQVVISLLDDDSQKYAWGSNKLIRVKCKSFVAVMLMSGPEGFDACWRSRFKLILRFGGAIVTIPSSICLRVKQLSVSCSKASLWYVHLKLGLWPFRDGPIFSFAGYLRMLAFKSFSKSWDKDLIEG